MESQKPDLSEEGLQVFFDFSKKEEDTFLDALTDAVLKML